MFNKKNKKNKKQAKKPRKLVTTSDDNSFISEQFRTIRANINFSLPIQESKTMLITSSLAGEGKSTIAANIAVVFAQEGKKVLLIDADLRKPTLQFTFNIRDHIGLTHVLIGKNYYFNAIQETPILGLDVLPCGAIPPNPTELLSSKNMDTLLMDLKEKYDLIILDGPPLITMSDSQILGNKCDGTLFIISTGISKKEDLLKSEEILSTSKAKIIGIVLNNYNLPKNYYQNYYTYTN